MSTGRCGSAHNITSENNWVRSIVGIKRADKIAMDELGVEVRVKETLIKVLVRSMLKCVGLAERLGDIIN